MFSFIFLVLGLYCLCFLFYTCCLKQQRLRSWCEMCELGLWRQQHTVKDIIRMSVSHLQHKVCRAVGVTEKNSTTNTSKSKQKSFIFIRWRNWTRIIRSVNRWTDILWLTIIVVSWSAVERRCETQVTMRPVLAVSHSSPRRPQLLVPGPQLLRLQSALTRMLIMSSLLGG